jgi:hypothetical protein
LFGNKVESATSFKPFNLFLVKCVVKLDYK